jgi:hypothetical protein
MPDTMQLLTVASRDVPLCDQHCRFPRITWRESVRKSAANTAFARVAKGLTFAHLFGQASKTC